jgi:phosphoribosylamine--glycine ligase
MKIIVIGNGGREHALAWKISQNEKVEKIYCIPGNGGTHYENKCENKNLKNSKEILEFALNEKIDFTIVGPENYLVDGIVDEFQKNNLKILGPDKNTSQLEASKDYAKKFMKKYNVRTASYESFTQYDKAVEYIKTHQYPLVIKADGLAAGKGVIICEDFKTAEEALKNIMIDKIFNDSGNKVVIEEFLTGKEASVLSITDGKTIIPFLSSKDHKQIEDGDKGLNTGGMGVICPNPYFTKEIEKDFIENIMKPTLEGIQKEKMNYKGIIFFGVILKDNKNYLLEYNVRFGDPETQAVLPLMKTDFFELIQTAYEEKLNENEIEWENKNSCCVVAASKGYPLEYKTGYEIKGYDNLESKVFFAGAKIEQNKILTSGGRVLAVTSVEKSLQEAIEKSYIDIEKISFANIYFRKDIGR